MKEIELQAVEIEINHACNRSCSYCPNSITSRKTKGTMSLKTYELVLNNLKEIQFKGRISYDFYNEPLLHPDFISIVQMTKKELPNCTIHVYSNGTLIDSYKLTEMLSSGVDKLIVTRHEQDIKNENFIFAKTYEQASFESKKKIIFRTHEDLTLVNRGGLLKHIAEKGLDLHPCHIPSHMLTVTVDARVLSCFEDYDEVQIFGDLKNEKLIDIWQKEEYHLFREQLKSGLRHRHLPCKNCNRKNSLPPFNS